MNDFPENDLQRLWQEQPLGVSARTESEIRAKAGKLQFDARAEVIGVSVVSVGLALLLFTGSLLEVLLKKGATVSLWSLGWLLCTALLVLCFAFVSYTFYTLLWPRPFNPDVDVIGGLQFCRQELRRRQRFLQALWRRSVPVFCVWLGMFVLAGIQSVVVGTLGGLSVVGVVALGFWLRKRDDARIESQLIELNLSGSSTGGPHDDRGPVSGRRHFGTLALVLIWVLLLVGAVVIYSLVGPPR